MTTLDVLDWTTIDTVLLDMDGTLLDLRFDNWFWQELVPSHYAQTHNLTLSEAVQRIGPKFRAVRGTLKWYCIDHWSAELELDIAEIKRSTLSKVGFLPGAERFLIELKERPVRRVLLTNAHPTVFELKDRYVGLSGHFHACYSTHTFQYPKESAELWPRLKAVEPFDPQRTLLIDDSLPVLDAARAFGIRWLRMIQRPDSALPSRASKRYSGIDGIADLS